MKFAERLSSLGFSTYNDYLRGEHWRRFKADYRASGRSMKCAVCEWTKIQLHHHTYERLGCEYLSDVTPLCRIHHTWVHEVLKENGWFVESTQSAINIIKSNLDYQSKPPKRKKKKKKTKAQKRAAREARAKRKCRATKQVQKQVIKAPIPRAERPKPKKVEFKFAKAATENNDLENKKKLRESVDLGNQSEVLLRLIENIRKRPK